MSIMIHRNFPRRFAAVPWLALALYVCVPGQATGQDLGDEKVELAKEYFSIAVTLFEKGEYEAALEKFNKSYELRPHDKLKYNIGVCLYFLKEYDKAGNALAYFLAKHLVDAESLMVKEALRILDEIKKECGIVKLEAKGPGIEARIGEVSYGQSPFVGAVYLYPGTYTIRAFDGDEEVWSSEITMEAGQSKTIKMPVEKRPEIDSAIGPPESDKVEGTLPGEKEEEKPVQQEPVPEPPKKTGKKTAKALFFVSLALTIATAAGGGIGGGLALKKSGELDDLDRECTSGGCGSPQDYSDYLDRRDRVFEEGKIAGTVSTALLAASGAMAATTLIILLAARPFKKNLEKKTSTHAPVPTALFVGDGLIIHLPF